ncbi:hypothetical protein ACHAQD_011021 [Fusarium lateritium]
MPSNSPVQEQLSTLLKQEKDNLVILDRFLGERNSVEQPAPSEAISMSDKQLLALDDEGHVSEDSDDDNDSINDQRSDQSKEDSILSNLKGDPFASIRIIYVDS